MFAVLQSFLNFDLPVILITVTSHKSWLLATYDSHE